MTRIFARLVAAGMRLVGSVVSRPNPLDPPSPQEKRKGEWESGRVGEDSFSLSPFCFFSLSPFRLFRGRGRGRGLLALLALLALLLLLPSAAFAQRLQIAGKIAFGARRDGNQQIYVMNADGTNQTRLSNNSVDDQHASWSPDGTKIVFESARDNSAGDIYVMNADGTSQTPDF